MKTAGTGRKPGRPAKTSGTSKIKGKTRKSGATGTPRAKKLQAAKTEPSYEEIRKKAFELYNLRTNLGEQGTPEDDWQKAIDILRKQ